MRRSGLRRGQSCAVIGVGGIGAFIVAAAAAAGASPLIALDIDEDRLATARALGAATLIDARGRELDAAILEATGGEGADVVIEASGTAGAPAAATRAARRGGRVLIVGLQSAPRELDLLSLTVREVEISTTLAHVCDVDLPEALALLARSELAPAVTDRVIALDDLVPRGDRAAGRRDRAREDRGGAVSVALVGTWPHGLAHGPPAPAGRLSTHRRQAHRATGTPPRGRRRGGGGKPG